MESVKSRHITSEQWYSNLQLEYMSYYVRQCLFERDVDEKRFKDICDGKKEKIVTYAENKRIESIFSCPNVLKYYSDIFYNSTGMPDFQYTPKNEKSLSFWDSFYFFREGSVVECNDCELTVLRNFPSTNEIEVMFDGDIELLPYTDVKRNIVDIINEIR